MNLSEAVERYVDDRKSGGILFKMEEQAFRVFSERVGDIRMGALSTLHIARFLAYFENFPGAWQVRFRLLERFLDFWIVRGEILPLPMPPRRTKLLSKFLPYVFTHSQLRVLIAVANSSQSQFSCAIDSRTLQTLVIVAYAVGLSPGELRGLKRKDLQLRRKLLRVRSARSQQTRNVPISSDLCALLASFSKWRFGTKTANDYLFATKQGKTLSPNLISTTFTRLCAGAGVQRQDGLPRNPRLLDLRNTFAVHRVSAWIEAGLDLDHMLPALAAYLGMENLLSSDRFLRRTPERFREPLLLLSPQRCKTLWRDDPALITFLSKL